MSPFPPGSAPQPEAVASLLGRLQADQREAVTADEPVVCVLAGAGAGKTRVLTLRVARRIEDGSAHPSHVLVCTFSRKAADELRSRLWALGAGGVTAGTFHRTALRLLRRHRADRGEPAPIVADRRAALASMIDADNERPARLTPNPRRHGAHGRDAGPAGRGRAKAASVLDAEIGWAKARLLAPEDYEDAARSAGRRTGMPPARIAALYGRYEAARHRRGVLDLDDLLVTCGQLLEHDQEFAGAARWWHRHLFVDEGQDMNEAQYRFLRQLVGQDPDLFVVGDPNQSVYGWNGADPGLLHRVTEQFAGTRVVRLDANHRSTPQVVAAAAAVLEGRDGSAAPTSTRPDGTVPQVACLATDGDEATWVARRVWLAHRPGRRWSSIAVLARTNAQLRRFAGALEAEGVPFRLAGGDLGPASDVPREGRAVPGGRRGDGTLTGTPELDHARGEPGPDDAGADDAGMDDAGMDDAGAAAFSRPVGSPHRGDGGDQDGGEGGDRVALSTFHRAKGLEWSVVVVTGLVEGSVPLATARTKAAKAEERRLLYVALTRAENELVCTWALHQDEAAAARGDAPRAPCPWLAPLRQAVEALERSAAASSPEQASEHLARIRQLLPAAHDSGSAPR